ncbi:hypothetical protein BHM03_00015956 [Ensete ventricosum]|nr:hypothetical protein BHM03_00015956 [Ensete ventricosum]
MTEQGPENYSWGLAERANSGINPGDLVERVNSGTNPGDSAERVNSGTNLGDLAERVNSDTNPGDSIETVNSGINPRDSTERVNSGINLGDLAERRCRTIGRRSRVQSEPDRRSDFTTELASESGKLRELPRLGVVAAPP